ncbi:MAG TPA: ribosomal-processing cysteine protease Prp [Spirochaetota bacterium]|nr:ribosomal-processing cysteine protease Prp [Spirochaetota bacterium]
MIRVTFENIAAGGDGAVDFTGDRVSFTVEGHSGAGVRGDDIYCAGVSAIVQSCTVALAKIAGMKQEIEQRDGFLRSSMAAGGAHDRLREAKAILGVMVTGLEEMRKLRGSTIDIIYKEV